MQVPGRINASPKFSTAIGLRTAGTFVFLGLIFSPVFSSPVFKYEKSKPEKGHLIEAVPYEKWLKRNCCGPACLAMLLNYWKGAGSFSQQMIANEIYDSENQVTYNSELLLYPRTKGFESFSLQGNLQILREVVGQNIPVIVLTRPIQQISKGHFRVVIGIDDGRQQVIFHDPFFGELRAVTFEEFAKLWELGTGRNRSRWMMAVVPEGAAFPFLALRDDPLTHINLATAHYRRSDFQKSKAEWLKAKELLNGDPYPLYSLAMVSLREGNAGEAESYAQEALRVDGKSAYAHDVLGLAWAVQGKLVQGLNSLGKALRLAPREDFIRNHYLQVRGLYIERASHEIAQNKENPNEKKR